MASTHAALTANSRNLSQNLMDDRVQLRAGELWEARRYQFQPHLALSPIL